MWKMYAGDNLDGTKGEDISVTTARECYEIVTRCDEEDRWIGDSSRFHSAMMYQCIFMEVAAECLGMTPVVTIQRDHEDGYLFIGRTGYVLGYVTPEIRDGISTKGWYGLAFIGG